MSVWAKTNTHLIYLEKESINLVKQMYDKRFAMEKLSFLKTIPAFKNMPLSKLQLISN